MAGLQQNEPDNPIDPTTRIRVGDWAASLDDIRPLDVWDWLTEANLDPSRITYIGALDNKNPVDYNARHRSQYLQSALANIDCSDPDEVRRFIGVLEVCLRTTQVESARTKLAEAVRPDGYEVDEKGNIDLSDGWTPTG